MSWSVVSRIRRTRLSRGNVTKEGITADLEWMKRVGIGGMQMFDGSLAVPQFTDKRLVWMTPDWKGAFRHTAAEADRLGLEMSMAASGGWSETAGPWVKPEQSTKKLVWSETRVQGPQKFPRSAQKKYTWTDYQSYTKDSPLLESGLMGPVTVMSVSAN